MLKSIDPILNADVLYALRAMGHGDDLVICDTNFPADAVARQTVWGGCSGSTTSPPAARRAPSFRSCRSIPSSTSPPCEWKSSASPTRFLPCRLEVQKEIDAAQGRLLADGLDRTICLL